MPAPRIFVSAASSDLAETREKLARFIDRGMDFKAIVQNWSLPASYKDIAGMLRDCIGQCDAVIHLAGVAYGSEPASPIHPGFRCSYTQLEYYEARRQNKPVYTLICGADFPFDKSFAAESPMLYKLQELHRQRLLDGDFQGTPIAGLAAAGKPIRTKIGDSDALALEIKNILLAVGRAFLADFGHPGDARTERLLTLFEQWTKGGQGVPPLDAKRLRRSIAQTQLEVLNREDLLTEWDHEHFSPLDTLVEDQNRRSKTYDLTSALVRHSRKRSVLLLGDPGSGKSVALRHYCRHFLTRWADGSADRRSPLLLYVNLREAQFPAAWAAGYLPTVPEIVDALRAFILQSIASYLPSHEWEAAAQQLPPLLVSPDVLLVLDSFDELSPLLDADERDARLENFSAALQLLLSQQFQRRGVLASRYHRRPIRPFKADVTLVVRPLSDLQLFGLIRKRCGELSLHVIERLFIERPDLVSIARNPFVATLLVRYLIDARAQRRPEFPDDQAAIFSSFIDNHLVRNCLRTEPTLREASVTAAAEALAQQAFETSSLEMAVADLPPALHEGEMSKALRTMVKRRFLRAGSEESGLISFAHRRFAEYFATRDRMSRGVPLPADCIATDSKWREALVLYCQIADDEQSGAVARECWQRIAVVIAGDRAVTGEERYQAQMHLRFLLEAFRHRPALLGEHRAALAAYIDGMLKKPGKDIERIDLLATKRAVEAIVLCDTVSLGELLAKALRWDDLWIRETALRTCRYAATENPSLLRRLINYVSSLRAAEIMRQKEEFRVLFGLSRTTKGILTYVRLRVLEIWMRRAGVALVFFAPVWLVSTGRAYQWFNPDVRAPLLFAQSMAASYVAIRFVPLQRSHDSLDPGRTIFGVLVSLVGIAAMLCWLDYPPAIHTRIAAIEKAGFTRSDFALCALLLPAFFPYALLHSYWAVTHVWLPLLWKERRKALLWTVVAAIGGAVLLSNDPGRRVAGVGAVVLGYLAFFAVVLGLAIVVLAGPVALIDAYRKYHRLCGQLSHRLTREEIAEHLRSTGDNKIARWLYVRQLASEPREVSGEWPGGGQPYDPGQKYSSTLGRLDEQWREDESRQRR